MSKFKLYPKGRSSAIAEMALLVEPQNAGWTERCRRDAKVAEKMNSHPSKPNSMTMIDGILWPTSATDKGIHGMNRVQSSPALGTSRSGSRDIKVPSNASAILQMYFNDGNEKRLQTSSSKSTMRSRVTSASLKSQVSQLLDAELAKVVQPLQEELRNQQVARERAEDQFNKIVNKGKLNKIERQTMDTKLDLGYYYDWEDQLRKHRPVVPVKPFANGMPGGR